MKMLHRVTFTRRADDRWDVLREREDTGERCTGARDLDAAFAFVRAAYNADGSPKALIVDNAPALAKRATAKMAERRRKERR